MAGYSPALLDDIRAGVDLVDLIGRFVNLRKAGVNWKGLCPFHAEKTPSFMVNPRKGIFHCFGCGVGGDAFSFLMRQDRLSFPEAVRALAKTAGVALPEERAASPADSGREELFKIVELAARFYADALWKPGGERARDYLAKRGIDPEVARRFGLGYAPEGWDALLAFMRAERVAAEGLETAGLVLPRQGGGGFYDRFRVRLIFAIRDVQGRVVAFGGRAFGDEQPKYLNSPETPIYTKGNLLYAIDLARGTMRERNRALLVEGYVDCLMAHQHGFTETVAALGTAFTPAQLGILRRYCEEVVTFFDADAAGQKAAERAAELLEPSDGGAAWAINRTGAFETGAPFRLKVALLPPGHDPDTFLREYGAAALTSRIEAARSLLGYALDRAVADPDGATGARARATAFARVALMLAKVGDAEEAVALSREAAAKLGVDPTQLWIEAQRLQSALRKPGAAPRPAPTSAGRAEDRALVRLLLHHDAARPALLPLIEESELGGEAVRAIVAALKARADAPAESLTTDLDDTARSLLAALLVEEDAHGGSDPQASTADFQRRLELAQRLRRIREVSRRIAEAQAADATQPPLVEDLRLLDREGREVHASTLGVAPAHHPGPEGSPRSPDA
ncbi:MAG: DNA primase [Candidatus Rokubacteria bacterium 13_1_40CM_4_69_5]|nr:MAG: DNA primase [Candidatus Rokubacteria bacterium 13_1_40CM_4_69_5]